MKLLALALLAINLHGYDCILELNKISLRQEKVIKEFRTGGGIKEAKKSITYIVKWLDECEAIAPTDVQRMVGDMGMMNIRIIGSN